MRTHILRLSTRDFKAIREVTINEFGQLTEIRGDTGQGKTALLESIEAGLRGIDPDMVRHGTDAAEIILELDNAKIHRIMSADGKEKLKVTDAEGKAIANAKQFVKAIATDTTFRPLDFVALGAGDAKGRTERLRQQRKMLLDAVPARIDAEAVKAAAATIGVEIDLDNVPFDDHALTVASAVYTRLYERRKTANEETARTARALSLCPAPAGFAPQKSLEQCEAECDAARKRLYEAEAKAAASAQLDGQRQRLTARVAELEANLPTLEVVNEAKAKRVKRITEIESQIAVLEAERAKLKDEVARCVAQETRHTELTLAKADLAGLGEAVSINLDALKDELATAKAAFDARKSADAHAKAAKAHEDAARRAEALDKAVAFFRDDFPRQIIGGMGLPVEGLGIDGDTVTFNGTPLHQLGTSEQIRVAVMVSAAINAETGFVLIDRAESLGSKDRIALVEAAKELGIQLVLTYVDPTAQPAMGVVVMREGEAVK